MTIFKKIIDREISAEIVYEDDFCLAFRDINPQAPTHVLLVPKRQITSLAAADPSDHTLMGHLLLKAAEVAQKEGLVENGYRVVINTGDDVARDIKLDLVCWRPGAPGPDHRAKLPAAIRTTAGYAGLAAATQPGARARRFARPTNE